MDGSGPELDWLLVRTQPQRERYAQHNIQHWLKIETYLPLCYDQKRDKIAVLFPSYLFVRTLQWYAFKGIWGVSNVIMIGDRPARLSHREILDLKNKEQAEGKERAIVLPDIFAPGQQLRVLSGHFADRLGLYDGMDGKARVRVLLEFMGRCVPTLLPVSNVEAA